jgi:hypothetical protein
MQAKEIRNEIERKGVKTVSKTKPEKGSIFTQKN